MINVYSLVNGQTLNKFMEFYYFYKLIKFRLISTPNFSSTPSESHFSVPDAGKNVQSLKNVLPLTE